MSRRLEPVRDRTGRIGPDDLLVFATIRNEAQRLPYFLDHYRRLGADHFLIVDNDSTDGTRSLLSEAPDVSHWFTRESYRAARFGMDWINGLLARYGHGHWCLTVDADEVFVGPHDGPGALRKLTGWLDTQERRVFPCLMVDLFPDAALGDGAYVPGSDPASVLPFFDPAPPRFRIEPVRGHVWAQGGARDRAFFPQDADRAPTINKIPLVRWHWRYAYVNSTHSAYPRVLNDRFDRGYGALLHTKFLPSVIGRTREERARGEHFGVPDRFADYYDAITRAPDLRHEGQARYTNWRDLEAHGWIETGGWTGT